MLGRVESLVHRGGPATQSNFVLLQFHLDLTRQIFGHGLLPFDAQKFLELCQLLLETHVRKHHGSPLADEAEGLVETHLPFLHEVGYNARC